MTDGFNGSGRASTGPAPGREARLVVPEGWVIDDLVRGRLERQLARASSRIVGVVAESGELPPGTSYRTHAEWGVLEPLSRVTETNTTAPRGVVLVRPGVAYEVRGGEVEVTSGPLLVDHGAHAHDPWRAPGPPAVASERGRPPFPRRPVVVFMGFDHNPRLADWVRTMVNRLVRRDVEGRLAMRDAGTGLHLTRPCLPCEESIHALRPDVVIALDEAAAATAPDWCGSDRSAIVVDLAPDLSAPVQLVSWRIGHASGRLRARISTRIDAAAFAELVNRLCSGPHPLPPPDQPDPDTDTAPTWPLTATERSCVVATESLDTLGSLRTDGLVDHLPAAGVTATLTPLHRGRIARVGRGADLVVLAGSHDGRAATELVEARRAAGRATVVDIVPSDLVCSPDDTATLTPRAARLVTACGMASAPNGAAQTALRALDVRAHPLPTVLTRARAAELKSARSAPATAPELVIGWIPGWAEALRPHYLDPVAEGLTKLLADRVDVRLEVGGTDSDIPEVLRAHDRVTILGSAPEPPQLGRWSIHVWTPPMIGGAVADDQRNFAEASYAGVPTVFPARALDAIDGYVSPDVLVAHVKESEEWAATLRALVDDDAGRSKRAAEAVRRSNTVDGAAAAKAAVRRFFSWALYDRAE